MGKAYGFFNCSAPRRKIEAELPSLRDVAQPPSKLELSLIEGMENLKGDKKLMSLAKKSKEAGIRYVLEATHPSATNKQVAKEVATILNQAYQSPLYQDGEPFQGEIVYEENGKYTFME